MKNETWVKNGIITLEVLLCVTALFLVPFRHSVRGSVTEEYIQETPETEETLQDESEKEVTETLSEVTAEDEETSVLSQADEEFLSSEEALIAEEEQDLSAVPSLFLSNKNHYIPLDHEPNLTSVKGMQVDESIAEDLQAMLDAAKEDGIHLRLVSAYRSKEKQERLFRQKIRKCRGKGKTEQEAYQEASMSVAVPGTSEHQLGLALDILGSGYGSLNEGFADTEAGIWLKENCATYGFILRYPKGKEDITGIIYEPWHFRYVGIPYAQEIMEQDLTLEEYLGQ